MVGVWQGGTYRGDATAEYVQLGEGSRLVFGGGGADTVLGEGGNDTINAGDGADLVSVDWQREIGELGQDDDLIDGEAGDDSIGGGVGRDTLSGGAGDDLVAWSGGLHPANPDVDPFVDWLDGGDGLDVLGISGSSGAAVVRMGPDVEATFGGVSLFVATGFERLDYIGGDGLQDISGGDGDDRIRTSSADDRIDGAGGSDTVQAGAGSDTVGGGSGDDRVALSAGGLDVVTLGEGDDFLIVSDGVEPGPGATPAPGLGRYLGGPGNDLVAFEFQSVSARTIAFDGRVLKVDGKAVATADGFESVQLSGPGNAAIVAKGLAGGDFFSGGNANDRISGGDGDDLIGALSDGRPVGYRGGDTLDGGAGDDIVGVDVGEGDVLSGGSGVDLLSFEIEDASFAMSGDLAREAALTIDGGERAATASGFERVRIIDGRFSDASRSTLVGGSGDDEMHLAQGAHRVTSRYGDDFVSVAVDLRADAISLGAGFDTLELWAYDDEALKMSGDVGDFTVTLGGRTTTRASGAERLDVAARGFGHDSVFGGDAGDRLSTSFGADTIRAGGGDDEIRLAVGGRGDVVSGGGGLDTLTAFVNAQDGVLAAQGLRMVDTRTGFELRGEDALLLRATSIEKLSLAGGDGADQLFGFDDADGLEGLDGADRLEGRGGDDTLVGGRGADTLLGGEGDDRLELGQWNAHPDARYGGAVGGDGQDWVTFHDNNGQDVVLRLKSGAGVYRIDGVEGGAVSEVEDLGGGAGDDLLSGDAGANRIAGGEGFDTLDGGAGVDTVDFSGARFQRVEIALDGARSVRAAVHEASGESTSDLVRNFENVTGTDGDDTIAGDGKANRIEGGRGADLLSGGGGADVFVYGETVRGSSGKIDRIRDFSAEEGDRIDLSVLDADVGTVGDQRFVFLSEAAFSGAGGELRVSYSAIGASLQADLDGDRLTDLTISVEGATALGADYFVL